MCSHINADTVTAIRLKYCFEGTFNLLASEQEVLNRNYLFLDRNYQELIRNYQKYFFKQQLPAIEQQFSAIF